MQIRTDSFQDAYEVYEDLGSGQFAVVRRCKDRVTGCEYAAKFVIKRRSSSSSRKGLFREKILQEIEILSELSHTNIIKLHQVFETPQEMILVLELWVVLRLIICNLYTYTIYYIVNLRLNQILFSIANLVKWFLMSY